MKIHSYNEWETLREVYVGIADYANWPSDDLVFQKEMADAPWRETPPPSGAVPQWVIDETNEDLDTLVDILVQHNVKVNRPKPFDFQSEGGMHNYCPRDRYFIAGDTIVDPAMMIPARDMEHRSYSDMLNGNTVKYMPRNEGMILDAANICRLGNTWLMLESASGNQPAYNWMCEQFPTINIELTNFYAGVHIDSTISLLNEGTALVNSARVNSDNLPKCLKDWDILWVDKVEARNFYSYPYASAWIGVNVLSIDSSTVIVDKIQTGIITMLEKKGFTVIPHELRHSRTLGGGYHCVTLDTWRENA